MFKKIVMLSLFILMFFVMTENILAQQDVCDIGGAGSNFCANENQVDSSNIEAGNNAFVGPNGILNQIVNVLTLVTSIASVIGVIIGGLMYATSNGDPSKANRGRSTIIYSVVGLIVSIFARIIVLFILDRIG